MHFLFFINKKKFEAFLNTLIPQVLNNINIKQFLAKKFQFKKRMNSNNRKKKSKFSINFKIFSSLTVYLHSKAIQTFSQRE
jgi:hypothetical protein